MTTPAVAAVVACSLLLAVALTLACVAVSEALLSQPRGTTCRLAPSGVGIGVHHAEVHTEVGWRWQRRIQDEMNRSDLERGSYGDWAKIWPRARSPLLFDGPHPLRFGPQ